MARKIIKERTPQEKVNLLYDEIAERWKSSIMGSDLQNVFTPVGLFDTAISKIDLEGKKKALVIYNLEAVLSLVKNKFKGEIVFFTQSLDKCDDIRKLNEKSGYNIKIEYIDISENPLFHIEMNLSKDFDIILLNPPYGAKTEKLDLKFIEACLEICKDEMVIVHPSSPYVDVKGNNKTYNDYLERITPFAKEVILFNGNGTFRTIDKTGKEKPIGLITPCAITYIDKNKKIGKIKVTNLMEDRVDLVDSFDNVTMWGPRKEFFSIKEKIMSKVAENGSLHLRGNIQGTREIPAIKNPNSFFVEFSPIRTGVNNNGQMNDPMLLPQFFTFSAKDNLVVKRGVLPIFRISFEFDTQEEGINFIEALKTPIMRFGLCLSKTTVNLNNGELKTVPWLDFKKRWSNEKICDYLGISNDDKKFIAEVIPPYYD
jgi:hypothetical protein